MLSRNLEKTLRRALALANARQHEYATIEHLLMALTDDEDAAAVLEACAVELERLRASLNDFLDHELTSLTVEGVVDAKPTAGVQRVIQRATTHVQSSGHGEVTGANILVALFSERESHAVYFLQEQNMSRLDAVSYISHGIAKRPTRARPHPRNTVIDRGAGDADFVRIARSGEARTLYGANLEEMLRQALASANARRHAYATLDHLLMVLSDDADATAVLKACAVDVARLRATLQDLLDHKETSSAVEGGVDAAPTVAVQRVILHAAIDALKAQSSEGTGANVLMALFSERGSQARDGRLGASYRVSVLNDHGTPMEFVPGVLERFFGKDREDAARIMLHIHNDGVAVCGSFPYEIAETKMAQVIDFTRRHQHPLQCTMEKD
jgi:ATP-dependent Clp protease ATP-binding subunit ClpA